MSHYGIKTRSLRNGRDDACIVCCYSDDKNYIVELVKRVTTISVETVRLVGALPGLEQASPTETGL